MYKRTFVVLLICFCVVVSTAFISATAEKDETNSKRTSELEKRLEINQKINESMEHQNDLLEIRLELLSEIQEKQSKE